MASCAKQKSYQPRSGSFIKETSVIDVRALSAYLPESF